MGFRVQACGSFLRAPMEKNRPSSCESLRIPIAPRAVNPNHKEIVC